VVNEDYGELENQKGRQLAQDGALLQKLLEEWLKAWETTEPNPYI
jgi:hypothetical protein